MRYINDIYLLTYLFTHQLNNFDTLSDSDIEKVLALIAGLQYIAFLDEHFFRQKRFCDKLLTVHLGKLAIAPPSANLQGYWRA